VFVSSLLLVRVPYLRDIYDHLVIMLHKLDAAIEVIVTLQSTYLAVVSIDVAAVSNEGNSAMKTLSASATILLPLSLIASLMGQLHENSLRGHCAVADEVDVEWRLHDVVTTVAVDWFVCLSFAHCCACFVWLVLVAPRSVLNVTAVTVKA
jgi:hypothetical protein